MIFGPYWFKTILVLSKDVVMISSDWKPSTVKLEIEPAETSISVTLALYTADNTHGKMFSICKTDCNSKEPSLSKSIAKNPDNDMLTSASSSVTMTSEDVFKARPSPFLEGISSEITNWSPSLLHRTLFCNVWGAIASRMLISEMVSSPRTDIFLNWTSKPSGVLTESSSLICSAWSSLRIDDLRRLLTRKSRPLGPFTSAIVAVKYERKPLIPVSAHEPRDVPRDVKSIRLTSAGALNDCCANRGQLVVGSNSWCASATTMSPISNPIVAANAIVSSDLYDKGGTSATVTPAVAFGPT